MKALAYDGSGRPVREEPFAGRPPGTREVAAGVR